MMILYERNSLFAEVFEILCIFENTVQLTFDDDARARCLRSDLHGVVAGYGFTESGRDRNPS